MSSIVFSVLYLLFPVTFISTFSMSGVSDFMLTSLCKHEIRR